MALSNTPLLLTLLLSLTIASLSSANVEKTIFLGPDPVPIPLSHPTLSDLHIDTLTPSSPRSLRTRIGAKFPNSSHPFGESTWLLLDNLQKDQRYEVRVCWTATVSSPSWSHLSLYLSHPVPYRCQNTMSIKS